MSRSTEVSRVPLWFRGSAGASLCKVLAALSAVVSLAIATPSFAVPFISFTDLTEGTPTLSVSGIDILTNTPGTDAYSFTGTLHIPFGQGILFNPSYAFVLLEPGGGVSDILTLTPSNARQGAVDFLQDIAVSFASVDAPGSGPAADCTLLETGLVQTCHLFSQNGSDILDLNIQSDVPEPATLALLAMGLAGLGFARRKQ